MFVFNLVFCATAATIVSGAALSPVAVEAAVPAFVKQSRPGAKPTRVQIFMAQSKFESLKKEMDKIGGGRIFIYGAEDAVRIRTGEKGYGVLQIQDE